ncbi:hypothetical protein [Pseudorhodoferax sp. Leaf267]|nr:hypothetical protein [Pseudorhodoferax sp. Leaf267]
MNSVVRVFVVSGFIEALVRASRPGIPEICTNACAVTTPRKIVRALVDGR